MVWYHICTSRATRGWKPKKKRSKITKTAFSRVDSNAPSWIQFRVVKWSIPEVFCFMNQFCNNWEHGRFFVLRFFTKTPLRHLVAIFGTKWGGKLKFVSRSISCQKGNFLSPTISKWQPWEKCSKKAKKWPNLGFRAITLEPRDLGTSNLASWHPLGMI